MRNYQSLAHVRWNVGIILFGYPNSEERSFIVKARGRFGEIIIDLCRQKGIEVLKGIFMMHLTEERRIIKEQVKRMAEEHIAPTVSELDEK